MAPGQAVERPPQRGSDDLGEHRDEQETAALFEVVAVDVGEVGPAPEADDKAERRIGHKVHDKQPSDRGCAQDRNNAGQALAQRLAAPRKGAVALDHDRNQQADQKRDRCNAEKTCPPTYRRGRKGERSRRQQRSQRSDPDLQAGERGKAIGRKPSGVDGERGHERACRSQPQQRPAEDQNPGARGAREHDGADDRDRGADHQANPRAESIERHAQGNLHGRERQKEDAGQETDLSR